jgi:hypothetical protein
MASSHFRRFGVLILACLFMANWCWAQETQADKKMKIVIGNFTASKTLEGNETTFANILSQEARKSVVCTVVVPGEYLSKVIDQIVTGIKAGTKNPDDLIKDVDKRETGGADYILFPSISKLGKLNIITAMMIDLRTLQFVQDFRLENQGDEDRLLALIEDLWRAVEAWVEEQRPKDIHIVILKKETREARWRETSVLYSNWFYKVKLVVKCKAYVYGFQKDNVGSITQLIPSPPASLGLKYNLPSPMGPGEFEAPPGNSALMLDQTIGKEYFYILYSKIPLSNPQRTLERHLSGEAPWRGGFVYKIVPHR